MPRKDGYCHLVLEQVTIEVFGLSVRECARKEPLAMYSDVCVLMPYLLVLVVVRRRIPVSV